MPLELHVATEAGGRAERRLLVLQQLTAALASARTYATVASVIIDEAMPALNAEVGVVALASDDGRTLRNVGLKGVSAATAEAWQSYPVDAPVPVAEAALRGVPMIVRTLEERNARYPGLAAVHGLEHGGPVTAFPLFFDGRLLGVLGFCWNGPVALDAEDLSFLTTLANQCGLAIERARLYEVAEREIAERKGSEEKLREANARKDDFLAMLAHELRNPLAPIRSAADVLATMNGDERLARLADVLARQVDQMKRIVDDLLDVSRIAGDAATLELEIVDLVALVRTTTSDHAPSFAAAGIELVVRTAEEPIWARADTTRLSQALANLLNNAMKFTPRGKVVSVSVLVERDGSDTAGRAVLEVRDEGSGIDAELLPRLFDPFVQADRTLARSSGGLGLGLTVVQGLVRLHGGEVSAASEGRGKGATLRVTLPVSPVAPELERVDAPRTKTRRKHVLIVEDNEDAAEMLGMMVERLGHEIRIAHSAADAIAILEEWPAHVVLSDLGLPDMDGFELARALRARHAAGAKGPFLVALSGYGSATDKVRATVAGFDLHVTKPINAATLARVLDEADAISLGS
jgi:signal transduction histidine kinase/ActR/RegA family two-component response regulator